MPTFLKAIIKHWSFKLFVGISLFYLFFSYVCINPIAQKAVPWAAKKYFNSQASVESVKFNPWRNQITIKGFTLNNQQNEQLFNFQHLLIDLEADGLFSWAWKFKQLSVTQPALHFIKKQNNQSNWSDLILALKVPEKEKTGGGLPRLIIQKLALMQGELFYLNASNDTAIKPPYSSGKTVAPIDLSLDNFSTLPDQNSDYHIVASLPEQKGTVDWQGQLAVNPIASHGHLSLSGFDLPNLLALAQPQSLPASLDQGKAGLSFSYQLTSQVPEPPKVSPEANVADQAHPASIFSINIDTLAFDLEQLLFTLPSKANIIQEKLTVTVPAINMTVNPEHTQALEALQLAQGQANLTMLTIKDANSERPLFQLPSLTIDKVAYGLKENSLTLGSILLDQANLNATRDLSGTLDWQTIFADHTTTSAQQPSETAGQLDAEISGANTLDTKHDNTKASQKLASENTESKDNVTQSSVIAQAEKAPSQANSTEKEAVEAQPPFSLVIEQVALEQWQLQFKDQGFLNPLTVKVPSFSASFTARLDAQSQMIDQIQTVFSPVKLLSANQEVATLKALNLKQGKVDLNNQAISATELTANDLQLAIKIAKDHQVNWSEILKPQTKASSLNTATHQQVDHANPTDDSAAAKPWQFSLDKFAIQNSQFEIKDDSQNKPIALTVTNATLDINALSNQLNKAVPVRAGFNVAQGGEFTLKGKLTPANLKSDLQLSLKQLSLKPFAPYLNQYAKLVLEEGALSINGGVKVKADHSTSFTGGLQLEQLNIIEEDNHEPFLTWAKLGSEEITLELQPNKLNIGTLSVDKLDGKFIIAEDKTINVVRVLREQPEASARQAEKTSQTKPPSFPIRIDQIKINEAEIDFADLSLRPQFGTHINTLNGVVNGLSSEPGSKAKLSLSGKVNQYGSADINGELSTFAPIDFTNIALAFKNLEMEKLTPYSGKFAGRKIDSGKLTVDLAYKINKHKLEGDNQFIIKKLKLGEKIESEDAADLPLDFAIAILEDNEGVIDLDLPVSGDLDNPKFNMSGLVWKALTGLLTKLVTAPFKALGALLGGGDEALDHISFNPGQSEITPPSAEVLDKLEQALNKRHSLSLNIVSSYKKSTDAKALKDTKLRTMIETAMQEDQPDFELLGPIDLSNVTIQKTVKSIHDELSHKGFFKRISERFDELPNGYYDEALTAIEESIEVTEAELLTLANTRNATVKQHLVDKGIAAERLQLDEPKSGKDIYTTFEISVKKPATAHVE